MRKCYFVKSCLQIESVEHQGPIGRLGLPGAEQEQAWIVGFQRSWSLFWILDPFSSMTHFGTLFPADRQVSCMGEKLLLPMFLVTGPGRIARRMGHLTVQVTLVVRGNSCLGQDKMGRVDREARREVWEEVEEGKETWSLRDGHWDSLASFQLCHTIYCLPVTEDAMGCKGEGTARVAQRGWLTRPGLSPGRHNPPPTGSLQTGAGRRDKYYCLQGARIIGFFLRSISFLR